VRDHGRASLRCNLDTRCTLLGHVSHIYIAERLAQMKLMAGMHGSRPALNRHLKSKDKAMRDPSRRGTTDEGKLTALALVTLMMLCLTPIAECYHLYQTVVQDKHPGPPHGTFDLLASSRMPLLQKKKKDFRFDWQGRMASRLWLQRGN